MVDPMQTLIERLYQVSQSTDRADDGQPFDYQLAADPDDPHASVREVTSLSAAVAVMQRCFEAERKMFPDTQPEEFRIEVIERHYLDLTPTA